MRSTKSNRRLRLFIIFFTILFLVLIGRLVQLMIIVPSSAGRESLSFPTVERGSILDRHGRLLAITTKLDSVAAWIPDVDQPEETTRILAEILDMKEKTIKSKLSRHNGFVYIKRLVSPSVVERIREYKEKGKLKGINLIPEYGRSYPEQELASHVIGYVSVDNIGLAGIEYTYNQILSPQPIAKEKTKVYGNQVFLTIDVNVQYIVEEEALKAYRKNNAKSVMVLVMDAKSGEILGYSSIPNFNPNDISLSDKSALDNRPISFTYEPGSVFKIFSISSMLQSRTLSMDDHFYCNGFYEKKLPNGKTIKIKDLSIHGDVTPQRILQLSCNVGAAYASDRIDKEVFYSMLTKYGFGKTTGIPLPGESAGILRKPDRWSARSKPTIAMGQEIAVSAIQIVSAATAIANGGVLLKPIIVKKIVSPNGKLIKEYGREPIREVLSPEVAKETLEMMKTATLDHGTARRARIEGIDISAKTGTAQVLDRKTGKYSKDHFISSIIGIFPTEEPKLIIYVVIDYPKYEKYGGIIASPVLKTIAKRLITYFAIPLKGEKVYEKPSKIKVTIPATKELKAGSPMPDFINFPKRKLLPLLKNTDFNIRIRGEGYVYRQEPKAGTRLKKGMNIYLYLK